MIDIIGILECDGIQESGIFALSLIANESAKCILKKAFAQKTFIENLAILLPLLICPNRYHANVIRNSSNV